MVPGHTSVDKVRVEWWLANADNTGWWWEGDQMSHKWLHVFAYSTPTHTHTLTHTHTYTYPYPQATPSLVIINFTRTVKAKSGFGMRLRIHTLTHSRMCILKILTRQTTQITDIDHGCLIRYIQLTLYGFKLLYFDPGRSRRSICWAPVSTESLFSIVFTYMEQSVRGRGGGVEGCGWMYMHMNLWEVWGSWREHWFDHVKIISPHS